MYSQAFWFVHPVKCSVENVLKDCSSYHEGTEINSLTVSKSFKHSFCLAFKQLCWQSFIVAQVLWPVTSGWHGPQTLARRNSQRLESAGQRRLLEVSGAAASLPVKPVVQPASGHDILSLRRILPHSSVLRGLNSHVLAHHTRSSQHICWKRYFASPLPSPESNLLDPSVFSECSIARCSSSWRLTAHSATWNDSSSSASTVLLVRQWACTSCMCTLLFSSLGNHSVMTLCFPQNCTHVSCCDYTFTFLSFLSPWPLTKQGL